VRRFVVLAVFTAGFAACGSAEVTATPIVFGISGGSIAPYRVSIQSDGTIRGAAHRQIPSAQVRRLQQEIERAHLTSRRCNGTLADVASRYIRASGRTVTVHGACEPSFERVWHDLAQVAGVRRG
jgi:3-oxoacyl-(acyl-carrier-protein) synthase